MTCTHERIKTWFLVDTHEPAGMWSCAHCGEKFMPITQAWAEARKRAEDMRERAATCVEVLDNAERAARFIRALPVDPTSPTPPPA